MQHSSSSHELPPFRTRRAVSRAMALTQVELMLSVVILALLLILAYPLVRSLRETMAETRCASNLRSVGTALLAVAAENNGRFPPLGKTGRDQRPTWGMVTAQLMGIDTSQRGLKTAFWCPADKTIDNDPHGYEMHMNHTGHASYAVNVNLLDWKEGVSTLGGAARGGASLGQIPSPSQTLLLAENHERSNVISWSAVSGKTWQKGWSYEYTIPNGTLETDPGKRGYHRGKNNWLFADGHIERLTFQETLHPFNRWKTTDQYNP